MTKTPFSEAVIDKFYECKGKIDEQMRKNSVINRVKRQILDASRRHKFILKYELTALYYDAIHHLCFNIGDDETEFYKALKNIMRKVENQIDKKEMICALAQFCESHPAELSPGVLFDYAARWHNVDNNFFSLICRISYKPFWSWMIRHRIDDFDLTDLFFTAGFTFEEVISWIASDEEYTEEFFEIKFDFFMKQIMENFWFAASERDNKFTIHEVFNTICRYLPQYEVRLLNYMYLHYLNEETDDYHGVKRFVYILDRMADYEYATGEKVFSSSEKNEWPIGSYDGSADVVATAYDIIYRHYLQTEVAEIAWILENRFGVDESVINDMIARAAILEFSCGNLNDLVHNEKLVPLFQFPVAYDIFMLYFDDIVKNTAKCAFAELEEKYGIGCKVVKI